MEKNAVVIGAGIAGLAAAVRLRLEGYNVHVYEAAAGAGGKLSQVQLGSYRFDKGPSLFTLPQLVEELFEAAGEKTSEHFRYRKLDVVCKYFYTDGTSMRAFADHEAHVKELVEVFGEDEVKVRDYFKLAKYTYETTAPVFLHRAMPSWKNLFDKDVLTALRKTPKLPLTGTLNKVHERFFSNPKTIQFFNRYATYNGSNPYQAPAMMMLIPHVEHGIGAFLPEGGMFDISQSIYQLALRKGVHFHFGSKVNRILHDTKKVTGISVNEEEVPADVVFTNMDMHPTYSELLGNFKRPDKLLNQTKSSSALIFYWGVRGEFPELDVHTILFAEKYEEEFSSLFEKGSLYTDPTVYIHITSTKVPSDAPKGCSNWFVMINVPSHTGQYSSADYQSMRSIILKKIERTLQRSVEPLIEEEAVWDPKGIETETSSYRGSLYGNASNSPYAAFLRHANKSSGLEGLYFCGGSVHPGGGVPLCLLSAKIAVAECQNSER
jgi:phytoene desaturase